MALSQQFHDALLSTCQQVELEVDVKLTRLIQRITKQGGVETAQELLHCGQRRSALHHRGGQPCQAHEKAVR